MNTIAAIQMCSSHLLDQNLADAEKLIAEAVAHRAKLIVLPENFAIMGLTDFDRLTVKEIFGQGKIQDFLSLQAKKHQVWIVGGTIPIVCNKDNKVKAACLVFNDKGETVARYDKIHLFDVTITDTESYNESAVIEPGHKIVAIQTPFGKLGLAICYDVRFPELFRYLFAQGVEIFVLPSAFTVKTGEAHWDVLTRSRAIENFSYLIGACQGGTHTSKRKTYGHSHIVDPWGTVLAKKNDTTPGIIYANIDLKYLKQIRQSIPVMYHQKIFLDISQLKEGCD